MYQSSLATMTIHFEQWREKFTTSAQLYDWPETKQILLLHQALTDRAFAFYQSLSAEIKSSMPSIFEALNNRFGLQSKNIMMRLQELNRKQQPHESVAAEKGLGSPISWRQEGNAGSQDSGGD